MQIVKLSWLHKPSGLQASYSNNDFFLLIENRLLYLDPELSLVKHHLNPHLFTVFSSTDFRLSQVCAPYKGLFTLLKQTPFYMVVG